MANLTDKEAAKINNDNPTNQLFSVGDRIKELETTEDAIDARVTLLENTTDIVIEVTADGTSGISTLAPYALQVIGVNLLCTATNASGTATLSDGTNDISDAITMAVVDTLGAATTIDLTYATLALGDSLTVTTNGAADRGIVTVKCRRL